MGGEKSGGGGRQREWTGGGWRSERTGCSMRGSQRPQHARSLCWDEEKERERERESDERRDREGERERKLQTDLAVIPNRKAHPKPLGWRT